MHVARLNSSTAGSGGALRVDLATAGPATMREVLVLWFCEQPTASPPEWARVYCGFRPGPTRVMPPSRQDDGDIRAPALACIVGVVVHVVACGRVWWRFFYRTLGSSARRIFKVVFSKGFFFLKKNFKVFFGCFQFCFFLFFFKKKKTKI